MTGTASTWSRVLGFAPARRPLAIVGLLGVLAAIPRQAWAQASCGAGIDPTITPQTPSSVGDTVNISLEIQTGSLQSATSMTVDVVRYKLDCFGGGLFPLCTDEGTVLTFVDGTEQTTCKDSGASPVSVNCELDGGDANIVNCDLTPNAVLPPNNTSPCAVSFDTMIASLSTDSTPEIIEGAATIIGSCDNGLAAAAQGTTAILVSATTTTSTSTSTSSTLNSPPGCGAAVATSGELWPPNRRFSEVSVEGVTDADGDPVSITINGITQDEPLTGRRGAGRTCPDGLGVGTPLAILRAERIGRRDGRVYHVTFTADDGRGGQCTGLVTVCVPHDHRPGHACVDEGPLFDSTGPCP